MDRNYLSKRLKELRNQRGLSQELLAEDSGLSLRTIQRIENSETKPTGETLKRIANALNVNPDELIDWSIKEDHKFLIFMNLSALTFIFFPVLGTNLVHSGGVNMHFSQEILAQTHSSRCTHPKGYDSDVISRPKSF